MIDDFEYGGWLEKSSPTPLATKNLFKRMNAYGSVALAVVGTAISVKGAIDQGKAAKAQADFQAQVATNNAIIAQRNADDAIARGKIKAGEQDLKTRQKIALQRTKFAAAGQLVDAGSSAEITSDTAALGKLDSLRIINNAQREAAGFSIESQNFLSDASAAEASGRNALSASRTNALGSLVTGASSVATKWRANNPKKP